jgi:hypothetical protein
MGIGGFFAVRRSDSPGVLVRTPGEGDRLKRPVRAASRRVTNLC